MILRFQIKPFLARTNRRGALPSAPEEKAAQSGAAGSRSSLLRTNVQKSAALPPARRSEPRSSRPCACAGRASLHPVQGVLESSPQLPAPLAHRRQVTRPGPCAAECGRHVVPAKNAARSRPRGETAQFAATARRARGPATRRPCPAAQRDSAPEAAGAELARGRAPRRMRLQSRRWRCAGSPRSAADALTAARWAAAMTRCAASSCANTATRSLTSALGGRRRRAASPAWESAAALPRRSRSARPRRRASETLL